MFLDWISQLRLLQHDPRKVLNVLIFFFYFFQETNK
jgi:hypothetical protein